MKRLGWAKFRSSYLSFLFSHKLVHVFVILLTVIFTFVNLTNKTRAGVLTDKAHKTIMAGLVSSEFGDIGDEELIEEFYSEESISLSAKQGYLDNTTVLKTQPQAMMTAPDEVALEEEVVSITRGGEALIKPEIASTKKIKRTRTEIVYHIVKPGDSVSTIAAEYEISVNTILWENNLSAYSLIRPGQKFTILPTTGITHKVVKGDNLSKISKKYGIEEAKITEANKITDNSKLAVGEKLIIPGGRKASYSARTSSRYTGISAIVDMVRPPGATPSSNKMNWPTVGYRITQYYSWRHRGVDIANKKGTAVYAADAGTVESTGWTSGYGNTVIINHGGGKKTRYAHLSKFYVKKGQKVGKGDSIAAMGSTGWSTGSHLHFEIVINGRKYNPLNYIR